MQLVRICFLCIVFLPLGYAIGQDTTSPAESIQQQIRADAEVPPRADLPALRADTLDAPKPDLGRFLPYRAVGATYGSNIGGYLDQHRYFPLPARYEFLISAEHASSGMDWLFYTLLACLIFLGVLRLSADGYLSSLYLAFFDLAIRQAMIREQLSRQVLPAFLLNVLFVFNAALFVHLQFPDLMFAGVSDHWLILAVMMLLIATVYSMKYVQMLFAGWLTGKQAEAKGYVFVVMMVNKIAGLVFLPMNILLAYLGNDYSLQLSILSGIVLAGLLMVRFTRCFVYASREFQIGLLQFIFLMLSFEVIPIMIAGKLAARLLM